MYLLSLLTYLTSLDLGAKISHTKELGRLAYIHKFKVTYFRTISCKSAYMRVFTITLYCLQISIEHSIKDARFPFLNDTLHYQLTSSYITVLI